MSNFTKTFERRKIIFSLFVLPREGKNVDQSFMQKYGSIDAEAEATRVQIWRVREIIRGGKARN